MSSIDLTESQQTILQVLVDLSREEDTSGAVKGERIAEVVDRNPGTIRNQMQSLKALQLVEGGSETERRLQTHRQRLSDTRCPDA